jgi:methyl-accepting chemotaxis protein
MKKTSFHLFKKFMVIILPVAAIFILITGYINYKQQTELTQQKHLEEIKNIAATFAVFINGEAIELITKKTEYQSSWYNEVYSQIVSVKNRLNLHDKSIKILRRKGNMTELLLSDAEINLIGQSYDLWNEMTISLNTGESSGRLYERNNQLFAVGFAPIKNLKNEVIALLMIEKDITAFLPNMIASLFLYAAAGALFLIIAGFVLFSEIKKLEKGINRTQENLDRLKNGEFILKSEESSIYLDELIPSLQALEDNLKNIKESVVGRDKINKQIKELLKIVSKAANGDFTVTANVTADTLGALADSFNLMISDLSELIRDAKKAAEQVASSTKGILKNIEAMSGGAAEQASQTEKTSNFAKEIAGSINNTNQSAQRAAEAARTAKEVAERGGGIVKQSIGSMHKIRDSVREASKQGRLLGDNSTRISEITDFISEIANRTSLLALNASIEAARAGEAGRGFTVVADEIRNLSEHSSKAAGEISKLLEDIQTGISKTMKAMESGTHEVAEGTKLVDGAGVALREILGSVEISTKSVVEISNATQEQTKFSQDIVSSLEHIAGIAKETAEGAKQSKESASQLEVLSKTLNLAVEKFRLAQ